MKFLPLRLAFGFAGLLSLGTTGACSLLSENSSHEVGTITLQKQAVKRSIPAEGYLKAEKATGIVAPRGYRPFKIAWLAENGSRVKKGDVVVRFDQSTLLRSLADGEDAKNSASMRLSSQHIRSQSAIANRNRNATIAANDLKLVQQRATEENDAIFSKAELLRSNIDGQLSVARLAHAKTTSKIDLAISGSKKKLLEIERKGAEIAIQEANEGLARLEIVAPHEGIFVYEDIDLKAGDTIYGGQDIGELPLVEKMEAEVFVLEADAMGLEAGKAATLFLESDPSILYSATIKKVDTLAKRRQKETPTQYFSVTLELEKTDTAIMKPGQRVQALINLDSEEALLVPRQYVFTVDGDWVVYKKAARSFTATKVTLGVGTPGRVVIKTGLSAGDVIATSDPFNTNSSYEDESDQSATEAKGGTKQ